VIVIRKDMYIMIIICATIAGFIAGALTVM